MCLNHSTKTAQQPLFQLGQVAATRGVNEHLNRNQVNAGEILRRHACGDWGDVPPEDVAENEFAVARRLRILSSFLVAGERVWVITEADRSVTTLLFPSEY